MRLGGMVVRQLGMLRRIRVFALFMGIRGCSVCFGGFVVVRGCFVVIVLWHCFSFNDEHSSGP